MTEGTTIILAWPDTIPVPCRTDGTTPHHGGNGYDTHHPNTDRLDACAIPPTTGWGSMTRGSTKRPSRPAECPDPVKPPDERRPGAVTYFGYDAPGNQETMMKATTDTALHRTADEPPSRLQCRHGRHSSAMSHPAATWPEDHDDSHDRTCTRRRHRLQAKLTRPSLRLLTLRSGEPS